jgi:hypothetical protein
MFFSFVQFKAISLFSCFQAYKGVCYKVLLLQRPPLTKMSTDFRSVIGHPNDSYPSQLSLNFNAPGVETHDTSLPSIMGNQFNIGSMGQWDAGTRNFNTGINTSNFSSINANFVHYFTNRFPAETCMQQCLCFIERSRKTPLLNLIADHEIASVHALNAYLFSPAGRAMYGNDTDSSKLMNDFGFAGSFNQNVPEYARGQQTYDSAIVVGRRARCHSVTRAFSDRNNPYLLSDKILSTVWLLAVRRKYIDEVEMEELEYDAPAMSSSRKRKAKAFSRSRRKKSADVDEDSHPSAIWYWTFNLFVSMSRAPPSSVLYIDDINTGSCIRVGTVSDTDGNNKLIHKKRDDARAAMSAEYGLRVGNEKDYLNKLPFLGTTDIMMNMG